MRRPLLPFQLLALMLAGCLPAAQPTRIPASFGDLMHINPDELGRLDIGRVNLHCAQGLPGEYMDLDG